MLYFDFIHLTPSAGLAGAATKLRMLTDREIGIDDLLENADADACGAPRCPAGGRAGAEEKFYCSLQREALMAVCYLTLSPTASRKR
jgi:hypothetical protein